MTLPESIGIGLGLLAIVAPVQWPKMHKAVTYPIATLGFLVLGWSVILAIEEATGMKIQTGPLTMLIGAAALAAGAVFWQAQVAKGQAERPYAEHGNRPVDDKPVPSKNSPNVSAGGNITIGHIGDVIN